MRTKTPADPNFFRTAEPQRLGALDYGMPRRAGS